MRPPFPQGVARVSAGTGEGGAGANRGGAGHADGGRQQENDGAEGDDRHVSRASAGPHQGKPDVFLFFFGVWRPRGV